MKSEGGDKVTGVFVLISETDGGVDALYASADQDKVYERGVQTLVDWEGTSFDTETIADGAEAYKTPQGRWDFAWEQWDETLGGSDSTPHIEWVAVE